MRISVLLLSVVILCSACAPADKLKSKQIVSASSDSIRVTGRVKRANDSTTIYWPGTSILFRVKGKSVNALLRDEKGKNYFNVILDGTFVQYFKTDSLKHYYSLADNFSEGEHTIELIKRTEWDLGHTVFYGLEVDGQLLSLPQPKTRSIEFFGNSITAGYAIDDNTGGDSPDSIFTNNYYTYAALTARHFNADYYCTVKSGIGVTISWFPLIMPELYDRLDPADSTSKWDFQNMQPNIVVVNLFQNDSWLVKMPDHPSFKNRFGTTPPSPQFLTNAYRSFISSLRNVYPKAHIICALGNMDATKEGSPWPGYVKEAATSLHDPKIHTLFFPYMNKGGHPRRQDNKVMADMLISFIEKNIKW
jgi:hypothetical protein